MTTCALPRAPCAPLLRSAVVALPDSLVRLAFRSADKLRERSVMEARLHGPGFEAHRVGLEGLAFPRYAYDSRRPLAQAGRYAPSAGWATTAHGARAATVGDATAASTAAAAPR